MFEYLMQEKEKTENAVVYYAEQLHRADIKLEVINGMLDHMKRAEAEKEPVETVTEERYAEGELVDTETVAAE